MPEHSAHRRPLHELMTTFSGRHLLAAGPSADHRDAPRVLARRIRVAAVIAIVALPIFGWADASAEGVRPMWLLATKLAQLALVIWTYLQARRAATWERIRY